MALKSLQDWTLEKQFKSVPNVVDVSSFGGTTREYQVLINPDKLVSYGLNIGQVEQQLAANNVNAGGSFIEQGLQQVNVRALGLVRNVGDIQDTVIKAQNGAPIRVRDIATVTQSSRIRLGKVGKAIHRVDGKVVDNEDVVSGIVLLRKGADSDSTLDALHAKIKELNEHILPPGVKIVPHLDRSDLLHYTTGTVMHNLTEGISLVALILFVFLGNLRGAFIVALTIPFSLLFASICLDLNHIPANLLSLGALDFGMVVEGAVVMVENIIRHLGHRRDPNSPNIRTIREATHEVQRPVFYSIGIIITAYIPIFTLQRVEGRLFKPMAWTVSFALLGALLFAMLIAPALCSLLFRGQVKEWENPLMRLVTNGYEWMLRRAIRFKWITAAVGLAAFGFSAWMMGSGIVGSEFLPHLDEGAIWARATLAPSTGPTSGIELMNRARVVIAAFPEVKQVVSQIGRPDDGTDTTGFFNSEYFIDLKPKEEWRPAFHQNKEDLIGALDRELEKIPGALWNFSQPIADNMEEAVSGVKGQLAIKIYGDDLKTLEEKGAEIVNTMRTIPGVSDLGLFRVIGQPNLQFQVDRRAAARYGMNVADVQDAIETAVGGKAVSQVLDGEQRYDLVVRYEARYRTTKEAIEAVRMVSPSGERVSLAQLCQVKLLDGASEIYREGNSRYVALKYSVVGRDLGSTVDEAIAKVEKQVKLPVGYHTEWAGEYESAKRSQRRLAIVVPITLLVICMILYTMFGSMKWVSLIVANVAMAPIGGLLALYFTGTHFSVSSGVGFLALFGVSVQTGVIMLEYINQLRARGETVLDAAIEGSVRRLRPIMMTMLVASFGLLPAATSTGIGSDSQRPFAIVIVGGLMAALVLGVFLLPALYVWVAGEHDVLPSPETEFDEGS
jgi:cobalt-zinc-cadmium resistance protein CzcA